MIRILFLTRSLEAGGAEAQLVELVENIDKSRFEVSVVTFYAGGKHFERVRAIPGVRLFSTDKKGRWDIASFFLRLYRVFRETRPQIACAYNGANVITFLYGKLFHAKTALAILNSLMNPENSDWLDVLQQRLTRYFSYRCSLVISNSQAGKDEYVRQGYCAENIAVIRNGFNPDFYHRERELGEALRAEWGVAPQHILIGVVGRLDPRKDHAMFLRAASLLVKERESVRFVCVGGRGALAYTKRMKALAIELGLRDCLIWAEERKDMLAVYNALDISALPSFTEGIPNVLGEAMCCEVPTVTTMAGDAAYLRGDPEWVVPIGDAEGMAACWRTLLAMSPEERAEVGKASRLRILAEFTAAQFAYKTGTVCESLMSEG